MSKNSYNMGARHTNISIHTNRVYNLTVDLQWYGFNDNVFYSYILSSEHVSGHEPSPPYYITGFCINRDEIVPLSLSESKYAVKSLSDVLTIYNEISLKGLEVKNLKRIDKSKLNKIANDSFYKPNNNIKILAGRSKEKIRTPRFFVKWGKLDTEIFQLSRVSAKNLQDYFSFTINIPYRQEYRSHSNKEYAKLFIDYNDDKELIFTGIPTEIIPKSENNVEVFISNLGEIFKNQPIGAMSIRDCNPADIIYLMTRKGGLDASDINIEGYNNQRTLLFTVIFPIENLKIDSRLSISNVEFLDGLPISEMEYFNKHNETMEMLKWDSTDTTSRLHVFAGSYYEAYLNATEEVEKALDVISHFTKSSSPHILYGTIPELSYWKSSNEVPQPNRKKIALIVNNSLDGDILMDWKHNKVLSDLKCPKVFEHIRDYRETFEEMMFYEKKPNGSTNENQLRALMRSLGWLRRSWETENIADKAIFASTALEFSVVGVKVESFLSKTEIKDVIDKAISAIKESSDDEDKAAALKQKISNSLNGTPLMAKVKHIIEELQIPITEEQISTLKKVRDYRNKVIHGGNEDAICNDDIEIANMVIAKIASFRINKLVNDIREVH